MIFLFCLLISSWIYCFFLLWKFLPFGGQHFMVKLPCAVLASQVGAGSSPGCSYSDPAPCKCAWESLAPGLCSSLENFFLKTLFWRFQRYHIVSRHYCVDFLLCSSVIFIGVTFLKMSNYVSNPMILFWLFLFLLSSGILFLFSW